jgi:hypothetical protein
MTSPDAYPQALPTARPFDIAGAGERLAAGTGGYEVVHRSAGLEIGVLREGHAVFVPAGAEHRFVGYEQLSVLVIFEKEGRA